MTQSKRISLQLTPKSAHCQIDLMAQSDPKGSLVALIASRAMLEGNCRPPKTNLGLGEVVWFTAAPFRMRK